MTKDTTMNEKLFENAICFTDLHVGLRHNSAEHNNDCVEFIEWLIEQGKQKNCDTCIFLGDFHHHRSNINILSLNYSMKILKMLNNAFKKTYILIGNHDLFYREKRDIHSMVHGSEFSNIELVDNIKIQGNVALIPWLVNDEWKKVSSIKSKYIFGHLELPGFKMNAMVEMPDHGELNDKHFINQSYVFSGHFHKRQNKGKVVYLGNPFGHNYSDAWDFDRGCMYLKWDSEPEFINFEAGPRFININLSKLLKSPELYLKPKTYLQVQLDVDITYEEAAFLRETFLTQYNVREFKLIKNQEVSENTENSPDIIFKSVDQLVQESLSNIESDSFNTKTIIDIYNNL